MAPPYILCAGRLYADFIFGDVDRLPTLGTEVFADKLEICSGGGAFLTAAALGALGQDAGLWSYLPAAPLDGFVKSQIAEHPLNLTNLAPAQDGSQPQMTVAMSGEGDRAFLTHKAGEALPALTKNALANAQHLHIGELQTLQENPQLIDLARNANCTISLDCGWDDGMDGSALGLIDQVDLFLPNADEYNALLALGFQAKAAKPLTVVKCGEHGAKIPAMKIAAPTQCVDVVDTTGAGDAFNAGFLVQWLNGESLQSCLAEGLRCGTATVQGAGGLAGHSKIADRHVIAAQ